MSSWRDTASIEAQTDVDSLSRVALDYVADLMERQGSFQPFGVVVERSGELGIVDVALASQEEVDSTTPEQMVEQLSRTLSAQDNVRAAAIATDAHAPDLRSEAVHLSLEHRDGVDLAVVVPYRTRKGKLEYAEPLSAEPLVRIWSA